MGHRPRPLRRGSHVRLRVLGQGIRQENAKTPAGLAGVFKLPVKSVASFNGTPSTGSAKFRQNGWRKAVPGAEAEAHRRVGRQPSHPRPAWPKLPISGALLFGLLPSLPPSLLLGLLSACFSAFLSACSSRPSLRPASRPSSNPFLRASSCLSSCSSLSFLRRAIAITIYTVPSTAAKTVNVTATAELIPWPIDITVSGHESSVM